MKPRTKTEKEVTRLSARLPQITEYQRRFFERNTFERNAYRTKKAVFCVQCGAELPHDADTCPHCGKLKIEDRRTSKKFDKRYASVMTTCKGWQVARHYLVTRVWRKGQPTTFFFNEMVQEWFDQQGNRTIIARCKGLFGRDFNPFSDMTIKHIGRYSYDDYAIYGYATRFVRVMPLLKRNGYISHDIGCCPSALAESLLTDNFAEMLIKTRQYSILAHHIARGKADYAAQVKICNRNGYIVKDAKLWFDYLQMLKHFGMDTHNAHYICPADLKAAHDRLLERQERERQLRDRERNRLRRERDIREAKKAEKLYKELHAKYLAIFFGNEKIAISVAQSVEDIRQEGEAMHHCVYACRYHEKADSLILFARDKQSGKRIETIEIDLKNYKVAQSRGVCNSITPQHNEILELCKANMHLIRKAAA